MKLRHMTSLYIIRGEEILLLYRLGSHVSDKTYIGAAGGHFEMAELEDARACLLREIKEEMTLQESDLLDLQLRYVTTRQTKGEIRHNYFYFAKLKDEQRPLTNNEGKLTWVPRQQVLALPMPFTAERMLAHYLSIGQFDKQIYAGIASQKQMTFQVLDDF